MMSAHWNLRTGVLVGACIIAAASLAVLVMTSMALGNSDTIAIGTFDVNTNVAFVISLISSIGAVGAVLSYENQPSTPLMPSLS